MLDPREETSGRRLKASQFVEHFTITGGQALFGSMVIQPIIPPKLHGIRPRFLLPEIAAP